MSLSPFHGLNVASSALLSYQRGMDTVAHNISNASNPNYSRQRVDLAARSSLGYEGGIGLIGIGDGVEVAALTRSRDEFTDSQFRGQAALLGQWEEVSISLTRVEGAFGSLSGTSLSNGLDAFWNSWQDLSNQPDSLAARREVLQVATNLTATINRVSQELTDERAILNQGVIQAVDQVNLMASELADLNTQIKQLALAGNPPNDLMDQRDALLDQLSGFTNLIIRPTDNEGLNIFIGSEALVRDGNSYEIETVDPGSGDLEVRWAYSGELLAAGSGKIQGLIDSRDTFIPNYQQKLDDFSAELITQINTIHNPAYALDDSTGRDFFSGTDASTIAVNAGIAGNPQLVAASSTTGTPGNNDVVLSILAIRDVNVMSGGTETLSDFISSTAVELAGDLNFANMSVRHESTLSNSLSGMRAATSGVNIDEEMVNMIKFQRAYQAAARMISTQNEMLGTLVRLGL